VLQAGIVGALAKRFGERALIRAGLALMGAAFIVAGLVPPVALFLATMGMIAVGSGLITPSMSALVSLATPADEQGRVLGVYQSLGSLGRAVGPFLGGLLYDVVSPGAPLWAAGAVLVLASLAAGQIPRRKRSASGGSASGR
jgi:DHA1 family tetracycline resistance protein-like MFS transporter